MATFLPPSPAFDLGGRIDVLDGIKSNAEGSADGWGVGERRRRRRKGHDAEPFPRRPSPSPCVVALWVAWPGLLVAVSVPFLLFPSTSSPSDRPFLASAPTTARQLECAHTLSLCYSCHSSSPPPALSVHTCNIYYC